MRALIVVVASAFALSLAAAESDTQPSSSVSQIYRGDVPVGTIYLEDSDNESLVIRNTNPDLAKATKAELFFSTSLENYQVSTELEKNQYAEIPWSVWGPKLTQPGRYQYRITLWKGDRDSLGELNEVDVQLHRQSRFRWNSVGAGFLVGYQPASGGSVLSLDLRWLPRYQFNERWAAKAGVGLPFLKLSRGAVVPALDLAASGCFRMGTIEYEASIGLQHWFSSEDVTGLTLGGGASFYVNPKWKGRLFHAEAFGAKYTVLFITNTVHFLNAGLQWAI